MGEFELICCFFVVVVCVVLVVDVVFGIGDDCVLLVLLVGE